MAKRYVAEDLGFVGEVTSVNASFIRSMLQDGFLPVIAPLGVDDEGLSIISMLILLLLRLQNHFLQRS